MLHQLIQGGIIISLIWLFYEDIKRRAISLWILMTVFLLRLTEVLVLKDAFRSNDFFLNIMFVVILVSCLYIYVAIRFKNTKSFFDTYFGWGDVLMFFNLSLFFSFIPFVGFMMLTFVIALLYALLILLILKKKLTIPLAGLQAMCLAVLLVFDNLISDLGIFTMSFLP